MSTTINPLFSAGYAVAEAERGKFTRLDMSSVTAYPSSGYGKYAILAYVTNPSMNVAFVQNNATTNASTTLTTAISSVSFSPAVRKLEVFNNSNNVIYLSFNNPTTYANLTAAGLPILSSGFYEIERDISAIYLGSSGASTDARILGHYIA